MKLDAGDLVWIELDPARGREQAGTRPALVITDAAFHEVSSLAFVCPITSNVSEWPFKVTIPAGLRVSGAILVDQMRAVDRRERILRRAGSVPAETLQLVRGILAALTGLKAQ
jgi:mRNA interferase MazF